MQFLANENFPKASVIKLRHAGYDVAAVAEDMAGAKDREVLARAVRENRIILTFDRDYGELIYRLRQPAPDGVVYLRFDPATPEEPCDRLLGILSIPELILAGSFTVVDRQRVRQRSLP